MRSYTLAALVSSLTGWLVAIIVYGLGYFLLDRNQALAALTIVGIYTLIISLIANMLLVQVPRYFIKKAVRMLNRATFALFYSLLAVIIFNILFGRQFGRNPVEQLTYLNAATNGFVLGFVFHSVWKPNIYLT
ncbi:hypothetical protein [Hymenobacter sp. PAMC 26628]|uniref:hypothetical protein n=1 Tax=Hymenobacter sp. PAMC 26628 TaxID=1484118 RepID=UPI0012FFC87A|nr:hypothetical protein [Hymenobacter sp. PAMC 26628]